MLYGNDKRIPLFKFQYGATNILPLFWFLLVFDIFKFQYGATNIAIKQFKRKYVKSI